MFTRKYVDCHCLFFLQLVAGAADSTNPLAVAVLGLIHLGIKVNSSVSVISRYRSPLYMSLGRACFVMVLQHHQSISFRALLRA